MSGKLSYMTSFVNPERHHEIQRSLSAAKVYENLEFRKPAPKRGVSTEPVKQKRKLSRREVKELGLYALPSDTVQYKDAVPLHRLWCGYFSKFFQSHGTPDVTDSSYNMIVASLLKADYHGAKVTVVRSKQPSVVGMKGIVVLDTKGTFKIVSKDNRLRTIPKNDSVFEIQSKENVVTLFGKHLNARPAERSVRKIKVFSLPDL
uniref:Ribonuclease P protein subunit p29 n=1 Tax=Anopheles triannulatus TaxID=58253 RepID=A0A2M4AZ71_9DIPT